MRNVHLFCVWPNIEPWWKEGRKEGRQGEGGRADIAFVAASVRSFSHGRLRPLRERARAYARACSEP